MRVALYARYSSDQQRAASIEDQLRLCQAYAERQGWQVVETFADAALSGASLDRPGLTALLAGAAATPPAFDLVLAESLDRLSRDQEHTAALVKRLAFAGLQLWTCADGQVGTLQVGLRSTIAQVYLEDLRAKVHRSMVGRVKAGKSPGGKAYGYRAARRRGPDGEPIRGDLEILEAEAEVVREIYRRYAAGESPKAIAQDLNARAVPAPRGAGWAANTIVGSKARGSGLLHNPLYCGRMTWNRVRMVKDPLTGKRVSRVNPEAEWIVREAPELAIVDPATWTAVQDLKAARGRQPTAVRKRAQRPFSGLLACGVCGGPLWLDSRGPGRAPAYACANHRHRGTCHNARAITVEELERRALEGLRARLLSPEATAAFVASYQAERRRLQTDAQRTARRDEKELGDLTAKIRRLVDRICDGADTPESNKRLVELEARKAELEARRAAAAGEAETAAKVARLYPDLAEQWRRLVAELHAALSRGDAGSAEAIGMVRDLTEKVVVTPPADQMTRHGPLTAPFNIELHGRLATLLATAQDTAEGHRAPHDPLYESRGVALVAGEGLEPPTRGL